MDRETGVARSCSQMGHSAELQEKIVHSHGCPRFNQIDGQQGLEDTSHHLSH